MAKVLFLIASLFVSIAVTAQLTYETLYVDYDSVWQFKNLRIIPIRPKKNPAGNSAAMQMPGVISLNQALRQGLVTVTERGTASTENVHYLRINNNSSKSVYVSSGEIMSGGRQDRIFAKDTILAPSAKDQYVPVMCVEELRWSEKEKKFLYSNYANPHLRKVLDGSKNQVLIWKEIGSELEQNNIKNKTMAYLSRNYDKKFLTASDEYFRYFQEKFKNADSTIVGFVAVSGTKVTGCDIFAGSNIFYGQLEPLLRGYIDEAVIFGAPVNLADAPIKDYMDKVLANERTQEDFVNKNGKIFRQNGKVVHINTF